MALVSDKGSGILTFFVAHPQRTKTKQRRQIPAQVTRGK
jgi:preprotein translocase subunit YajC